MSDAIHFPTTTSLERHERFETAYYTCVVIAVTLLLLVAGTWTVVGQNRRIKTYRPVKALVLLSRIEQRKNAKGGGYTSVSVVRYQYTAEGHGYICDKIYPYPTVRRGSRSEGLPEEVTRYPIGTLTQAFYDPNDPSDAFLVRQYCFWPYCLLLFGFGLLSLVMGLLFGLDRNISRSRGTTPLPRGPYQFEILPDAVPPRCRACCAIVATWAIGSPIVFGHYFVNNAQPDHVSYIFAAIYGAGGCLPFAFLVYYWRRALWKPDIHLYIDQQHFALGTKLNLFVQHVFHRPVWISEYKIGIVARLIRKDWEWETCPSGHGRQRTVKTTETVHYESWATIDKNQGVEPGVPYERNCSLSIPWEGQPSTSSPCNPHCVWTIEVSAQLAKGPSFSSKHQIEVCSVPAEMAQWLK
jgi:hypothetical protein